MLLATMIVQIVARDVKRCTTHLSGGARGTSCQGSVKQIES